MRSLSLRALALAGALSGVAGFVDAIGFVHLGGYFVSFMTGNSTRAGVELTNGSISGWLRAFGLVLMFVLGVVGGSLVRGRARLHRAPSVLLLVCAALGTAAVAGFGQGTAFLTAPLMAFAMGALNTIFTKGGEVSVGLTYMTGSLVKLGQAVAASFTGTDRRGWVRYFLLWLAISTGAILGAVAYRLLGLSSLWIAVLATGAAAGTLLARGGRTAQG